LAKIIIYHCAPTLTGIKAASLINLTRIHGLYQQCCHYSTHQWNEIVAALNPAYNVGCYECYHQAGEYVLILFYNPDFLTRLLSHIENRRFLAGMGYPDDLDTMGYLQELRQRLNATGSFAHEIGIFLGIPLDDVCGFIANNGKNYIFNQYWKVYQNPQGAKKIFAAYDRAKTDLLQKYKLSPEKILRL
jgi:hypothetical protein